MSMSDLAKELGVDTDTINGLVDKINKSDEVKDAACEAIGALNPDGFFANLATNDFRAMSRGKVAGKAGAVLSTGLKVAGVVLAVFGARAGYRRLSS